MNDRFFLFVRKKWICFSIAVICGGFTACTDDYDLDDPGNYPSWLGGSIYGALKDPASLQEGDKAMLSGTFTLKGQANARLYPDKLSRQPGDIDLWVEGGYKSVVEDWLQDRLCRQRRGFRPLLCQ